MVSFDDNQLIAEVQTMTLILYYIRKNAIELVSLQATKTPTNP